ncbi:hypothetical protein CC77DRAFT_80139 [Alternaria alternata]|uniref:Uncharacterized protein n=1 Tax=Alternaria alternata TaxID=5599 RepID=A0A177DLF0_ALTAL|nr:hypothetical protein CC77DRAFT_80139 [Alternaria alternata]OAG20764.1 hypothetical protein CC77DRAFT_80139 [Alternaria alternata]
MRAEEAQHMVRSRYAVIRCGIIRAQTPSGCVYCATHAISSHDRLRIVGTHPGSVKIIVPTLPILDAQSVPTCSQCTNCLWFWTKGYRQAMRQQPAMAISHCVGISFRDARIGLRTAIVGNAPCHIL